MKCFVSGGAGFIGSHVVDALIERGHEVMVFDNLITGRKGWINSKAKFFYGDLLALWKFPAFWEYYDIVFHFAANADVRGGSKNQDVDYQQNVQCTYNLLKTALRYEIKQFVFASSSAVYGEPNLFPTPETYAGVQTSMYGATKLGCEAMIQAFCEYSEMKCYIYRFVSWIGERYTHGVIFDLVKKLLIDPYRLELLGDGRQLKSYLYAKDGVEGIMAGLENGAHKKNLYNLGHSESMMVGELARIVCDEMEVTPKIIYRGGQRGWIGDSPIVKLDTTCIESLGWKPTVSIDEGIRRTVHYLLKHKELLERT